MEGVNFFQSKVALTKAFPKKKLTMTRLHQLYRDIYTMKPKRKVLHHYTKDEDDKSGGFYGERSLYDTAKMDKLIDKYLNSDDNGQFSTDIILQLIQEGKSSNEESLGKTPTTKEGASFLMPNKSHNGPFNYFQEKSDNFLPSEMTSATPKKEKAISLNVSPRRFNIKKASQRNWPSYLYELQDSINKHSLHSSKSTSKYVNSSHRENKERKNSFNGVNSQIKVYLSRVGINHHKTPIEEAESLAKSTRRSEKHEAIPVEKLSKFSNVKGKRRKQLETMSIDARSLQKGHESLPKINVKTSEANLTKPVSDF